MLKKILLISSLLVFWCCSDFQELPPESSKKPEKPSVRGGPTAAVSAEHEKNTGSTEKSSQSILTLLKERNKKKTAFPKEGRSMQADSAPYRDTVFLSKLRQLKLDDVEIDLSEPASRAYLFPGPGTIPREGVVVVSRERFLRINFDNDILNNTDRYYTNGIRIDIISPFLKAFPLNYLMIPYWGTGVNYYGLSIVQNMYTPSTTKTGGILYGDRPYAAYLYLGNFKISNDPVKRFRQTTEFDIGIIGPYSFGGVIQKSFHEVVPTNNEPLGWLYQVQNDVVLNYNLCFEKGILSGKNVEVNVRGNSALGTLYTNFSGGLMVRAGLFNPYFANLGIARAQSNRKHGLRNTQVFFFVDLSGKVVGYDATLQGGMFNHRSVYTLPGEDISRVVFEGVAGITINFGGFRLDAGQYLLSPEFHGGWWHHWVHTGLTFTL